MRSVQEQLRAAIGLKPDLTIAGRLLSGVSPWSFDEFRKERRERQTGRPGSGYHNSMCLRVARSKVRTNTSTLRLLKRGNWLA